MRIALITPGFSADQDDDCIPVLLDLVRELARHDEVVVFALRYPHHRQPYRVHGAQVLPGGGAQAAGWRRLPILWRSWRDLRRQARLEPFDLVHAFWAHEPGWLATAIARRLGCRSIVSVFGGELADLPAIDYGGGRSRANRWLVDRALATATVLTAGSSSHRQQVLTASRRDLRGRLITMVPGVDVERFAPGSVEDWRLDGDPCLLHVGSMVPVKNTAVTLRAFAQVLARQPDARLHLVGDGPLRPDLEQLADRLGLAQAVRWHGQVPRQRLIDAYRSADLLVQSSLFESTAMVVLEAAACGLPAVGTATGVLPQLTRGEWLSAPADEAALAAVLVEALADRPRLVAAGRQARVEVEQHFSLASWVDQLRALYSRSINPR